MTPRNALDFELMTEVSSISYSPVERVGVVYMPKNCCTSFEGAINLFQRIDPKVELIVTVEGNKVDTIYFKMRDGKWGSLLDDRYWPQHAGEEARSAGMRVVSLLKELSHGFVDLLPVALSQPPASTVAPTP